MGLLPSLLGWRNSFTRSERLAHPFPTSLLSALLLNFGASHRRVEELGLGTIFLYACSGFLLFCGGCFGAMRSYGGYGGFAYGARRDGMGRRRVNQVDLAFRDLNQAAGAQGIAGCKLAYDLRDDQSQGSVGVDQARQLVDLKKVPVIIGSIISSVSIPMATAVTAPAGVVQISPASSTPSFTKLGMQGKTNGWFFRTITADSLQGAAAAKYALDQGMKSLTIIYVNNDFGVNMVAEFKRAYQALGGKISGVTAYNPEQSSYNAEVTNALNGDPAALYFIGYPGDGTTIVRTWIQQGGPQRFLLNDGMNTADFIKGVGRSSF
jgi:ABC-type branched-subunit amino acid transport system substrate-binding protein